MALIETNIALLHVLIALDDSIVVLSYLLTLSSRAMTNHIVVFRGAVESRRTLTLRVATRDALGFYLGTMTLGITP